MRESHRLDVSYRMTFLADSDYAAGLIVQEIQQQQAIAAMKALGPECLPTLATTRVQIDHQDHKGDWKPGYLTVKGQKGRVLNLGKLLLGSIALAAGLQSANVALMTLGVILTALWAREGIVDAIRHRAPES